MKYLLRAMALMGTTQQGAGAATQPPGSPLVAYIDTLVERGELGIPDPLHPGGAMYWLGTSPYLRHSTQHNTNRSICVRWAADGYGIGPRHRRERRANREQIERNFSTLIAGIICGMPVYELTDGLSVPRSWWGFQLGAETPEPEPEFVWQPEHVVAAIDADAVNEAVMGYRIRRDEPVSAIPVRRREIIHVPRNTDVEIVLEGGMRFVYENGQITTYY